MDSSSADTQEPLRVSQLDASELDSELFDLLKDRLEAAFKYFKPAILVHCGPELNAALRYILWKYTIGTTEATIGQQLLDLRYLNDIQDKSQAPNDALRTSHAAGNVWMTTKQKRLYAALTIGGSWLQERRDDLSIYTEQYRYSTAVWRIINIVNVSLKVAALINFLIFLTRGRHQHLVERLLGIRAVFPRPQGIRQVGFEYMDRELLWHGFAEFLFFALPLINFSRLKNFVMNRILPWSRGTSLGSSAEEWECVVCGEWPYNPRHIGCDHLFCYYCIYSNHSADPAFCCPTCGQRISSVDSIEMITMDTRKS